MISSYYSEGEISSKNFLKVGNNVKVSKLASFYGQEHISFGNNVRIDDFCIISGNIVIGNNVHLAAGCYLFGGDAGIILEDFVGLSSRVVVYAVSDDYSGLSLTNPTIPLKYRSVVQAEVILRRHVIVGTGSVILPGVEIGEGSAVGALSLVNKSLPSWKICLGIPARPKAERKNNLIDLEKQYLSATHKQKNGSK